jgi:hypothetical protein
MDGTERRLDPRIKETKLRTMDNIEPIIFVEGLMESSVTGLVMVQLRKKQPSNKQQEKQEIALMMNILPSKFCTVKKNQP